MKKKFVDNDKSISSYVKENALLDKKYSVDSLKNLYLDNQQKFISTILSIAKTNPNNLLNMMLSDWELYEMCVLISRQSNITFNSVEYSIIRKLAKRNPSFVKKCIRLSEIDYATLLGEEDFLHEIRCFFIKSCPYINVLNNFFQKDKIAFNVFNQLSDMDIKDLLEKGVIFSKEELASQRMFFWLRNSSIIEFRSNVNMLICKQGYIDIEKKVEEYYISYFKKYNPKTKMFTLYEELLKDFQQNHFINLTSLADDSFLYDFDLVRSSCNKEDLVRITSRKISELVIDFLFKDNIYNVIININEMLGYNRVHNNNLISPSVVEFFEKILNFDSLSSDEKIKLFYGLKDKKVDVLYYDTLRSLKRLSYERINNSLLRKDKIDSKTKEKRDDAQVYDYRNNPFFMLVRVIDSRWKEETDIDHECYSLISNENTDIYNNGHRFIYGYDEMDISRVIHVFESDSYSIVNGNDTTPVVNRLMESREIVLQGEGYSEIQIKNRLNNDHGFSKTYLSKKPSYLVAINVVTDSIIDESNRLNIPIILIKEKRKKGYRSYMFNNIAMTYASNSSDEERRKRAR